MIPNTDINCGKCATPMYSDCVLWSGSESTVACIPLSSAGKCCDSSITQVITDVAQFACDTNVSDLANYNYQCLASSCACSITDFFDLFNLVITKVCNLEAGTVAVGDLNWNCYATPASAITGITQVIQYLIDQTCQTGKPSGLNPYCYTLPETYDINTVLEAIMEQTCDMLQLSGLTWGSCFDSPISNSLQDVIQNILTTVCTITKLDLNWGCFVNSPLDNSINSAFQNTIDELLYRFDFQNINWSCISGSTNCETTISVAFNKLITYMCSKLDMSTINWGCFTSTSTNSIVAVINQLITDLCNISLTWGCLTPTLGLGNQLQTIINAINAQTIAYNTNHFVVTGTTCSDRGLSLIKPSWTAYEFSGVISGGTTYVSHTASGNEGYLVDPFGNVRLSSGLFDCTDTVKLETFASTIGSFGFYIPIAVIPTAIAPTTGSICRSYGYVDCWIRPISGTTSFYATSRVGESNVASVDTISSDTSTVGYFNQYKRIIPAQLIKGNTAWYLCIDKVYLPGGVKNASGAPLLIQTSSVRVYLGTFNYNINN